MGSNGDRSQIPLQLEFFKDGSKMFVKTNLYLTVGEFKLDVAHLTGIASDQQIFSYKGFLLENPHRLVYYEVQPHQTIEIYSSQPPNTSLSGGSTPAPSGTYKVDETNTSDKKPNIEYPDSTMDILNTPINILLAEHPEVAKMLETIDEKVLARAMKVFPLFLLYLGIKRRLEEAKTEGSHNSQETEENQPSLGGSNLVDNSALTLHDDKLLEPVWSILRDLENDADFISAISSCALEEKFASELKVVEQQGFMDRVKKYQSTIRVWG